MGLKLVVGLGNPGNRYAGTPHNVGFAVIDRLAKLWNSRLRRSWRWRTLLAKAEYGGSPVWLAQPLSFMNNSGAVVAPVMRTAGLAPSALLVVLDDVDLPIGRIRIRSGGGDAGHRGLRSIRNCLGSDDFVRIRLGVGPEDRPENLVEYVLKRFPASAMPAVDGMVALAGEAVCRVLDDGVATAMNEYNGRRD